MWDNVWDRYRRGGAVRFGVQHGRRMPPRRPAPRFAGRPLDAAGGLVNRKLAGTADLTARCSSVATGARRRRAATQSPDDRRRGGPVMRFWPDSGRFALRVRPETPGKHQREHVQPVRDVLPRGVRRSVALDSEVATALMVVAQDYSEVRASQRRTSKAASVHDSPCGKRATTSRSNRWQLASASSWPVTVSKMASASCAAPSPSYPHA